MKLGTIRVLRPIESSYLAGYFDASGHVFAEHGWRSKIRIAGYDRQFLENLRNLVGSGSISREIKPAGIYYRFEISGKGRVRIFLETILPYLRVKRTEAQRWLAL